MSGLERSVDGANAADDLQVVILGKIEKKPVGGGFYIIQSAIHKHTLFTVIVAWAYIGGVFHFF